MEKTHINHFAGSYIGSWDLLNEKTGKFIPMIVKIKGVTESEVYNQKTKLKEMVKVIKLENHLPMILNATNKKKLIALYGTGTIAKWIGRSFELTVKKIRVAGQTVDALRISDKLILPEITPKSKNWSLLVEKFKSNQITIEQIRESFSLSPSDELILKS